MEIMKLLVMGLDEDCLYDHSMPKSIPGPEGCPVGFAMKHMINVFQATKEDVLMDIIPMKTMRVKEVFKTVKNRGIQ